MSTERRSLVEQAVGTWAFSAHDYTDDELLYGALVMLKHALQMPELAKWVISEGKHLVQLGFSQTNTFCRKTYRISFGKSKGIQRVRQIPQLSPRGRRSPGALSLPGPDRYATAVSFSNRDQPPDDPQVPRSRASGAIPCTHASHICHWARRWPPRRQQCIPCGAKCTVSSAVQRSFRSRILPLRRLFANTTSLLATSIL
jgi:hypothetical protein